MTRPENRAADKLVNAFAFMAACWLLFFAMVALAKIAERPQHLPRYMVSLFPSAVLLVATVNAQPPNTGLALADLMKGESGASPRILEVSTADTYLPGRSADVGGRVSSGPQGSQGLAVTACRQVASLSNPPVVSRDLYRGLIFALILVAPFWVLVGCAIRRWA